jgi:hypothetical protein
MSEPTPQERARWYFKTLCNESTNLAHLGRGDQAMAMRVVAWAIADYVDTGYQRAVFTRADRDTAWRFISDKTTAWKEHRRLICDIAGIRVGWLMSVGEELSGYGERRRSRALVENAIRAETR